MREVDDLRHVGCRDGRRRLHEGVEAIRNRPVPLKGGVLVVHGDGRRGVARQLHQLTYGGALVAFPREAAPAQVVEVQPGHADGPARCRPSRPELGTAQRVMTRFVPAMQRRMLSEIVTQLSPSPPVR